MKKTIRNRAATLCVMALMASTTSVWAAASYSAPDTAIVYGDYSTAVGENSVAGGNDINGATAIGDTAKAIGTDSTAVGRFSLANATNSTAIGSNSAATGENSTAVGHGSQANATDSTAIGEASKATGVSSTAVGQRAEATMQNSTALGQLARASGTDSTALGQNAQAIHDNSVALGANSITDRPNSVSVGSPGAERQITNVADGTAMTDAVNIRQLYRTGALSAALSGLAPIPYDPSVKTQFSFGFGGYHNQQALAVGMNHYFNDSVLMNFGAAFSGGENMFKGGITWKLGKSSAKKYDANTSQELAALKNQLQQQDAEMKKMKEQLAALMKKN